MESFGVIYLLLLELRERCWRLPSAAIPLLLDGVKERRYEK
jgi:hypothetical protein